jgi:hypothetical protein
MKAIAAVLQLYTVMISSNVTCMNDMTGTEVLMGELYCVTRSKYIFHNYDEVPKNK